MLLFTKTAQESNKCAWISRALEARIPNLDHLCVPAPVFVYFPSVPWAVRLSYAEISEVIRASFLIPIVPLQRSAGGVVPSRNACCLWGCPTLPYLAGQVAWRRVSFPSSQSPSFKFCWPLGREVSAAVFPSLVCLPPCNYTVFVWDFSLCVCVCTLVDCLTSSESHALLFDVNHRGVLWPSAWSGAVYSDGSSDLCRPREVSQRLKKSGVFFTGFC